MSEDAARRPPAAEWRPIEAIPVFVLAFAGLALGGSIAALIFRSVNARDIAASAFFEISLAAIVIGWIQALHRGGLPALGYPARPRREVGTGVLTGIGVHVLAAFVFARIVIVLVDLFTHHVPVAPQQVPTDLQAGPSILLGIVVVLGAPVGEELFFRGFLFRALRARYRFWIAGAVSSLAFGLVHVEGSNWFLVPVMFGVGFCFAYVYERTGSLLTPIAAHATFNLIGILFLTFGR